MTDCGSCGKKVTLFWIILAIMLALVLCYVLVVSFWNKNKENESSVQIPNPSATNCIQEGYEYEIRTNPDGSQTGYCISSEEKECEAWEYFRGECEL